MYGCGESHCSPFVHGRRIRQRGCLNFPSSDLPREDGESPASIANVGELAENIYDLAKDNQWAQIAEKLAALKKRADSCGPNPERRKKRRSN